MQRILWKRSGLSVVQPFSHVVRLMMQLGARFHQGGHAWQLTVIDKTHLPAIHELPGSVLKLVLRCLLWYLRNSIIESSEGALDIDAPP